MKTEQKKEDLVYVGIDDPTSIRRDLLEASKSLVHVLKGQHNLKELRNRKHRLTDELRNRITAISDMLAEAKALLPEATFELREVKTIREPRSETVIKATIPDIDETRPEKHQLDRYEQQLNEIEDKLRSL
jgi:hypothetical protein